MRTTMNKFGLGVGIIALSAALLSACNDDPGDQVLSIDGRGSFAGIVFFDANGTGAPDGNDTPMEGLNVQLLAAGTRTIVGEDVTDDAGQFLFESLPIGTYKLAVSGSDLGDTLQIVDLDTVAVVVPRDSQVVRVFGVGYPSVTIAEARELGSGIPVFVEGVTIAGPLTFNDNTMHIRDAEVAIRGIRAQRVQLAPGDSVRLRGRTSTLAGQPVISDVVPFLFAGVTLPPTPIVVETGEAATAREGALDANFVRVENAVVADTFTIDDDFVAVVNDGSGELELVLDKDINFGFIGVPPGFTFARAVGVLVPVDGSDLWQLKPRTRFDFVLVAP